MQLFVPEEDSSAAEESVKKSNLVKVPTKNKEIKRPLNLNLSIPPDMAPSTLRDQVAEDELPQLVDMKTLIEKFPHLKHNNMGEAICRIGAGKKLSHSISSFPLKEEEEEESKQDIDVKPEIESKENLVGPEINEGSMIRLITPEEEEFRKKPLAFHDPLPVLLEEIFAQTRVPSFFVENDYSREVTTDDIQAGLRNGRFQTALFTASYEKLLLGESGSFLDPYLKPEPRVLVYPPCVNDTECVTWKFWQFIPGLTRPIVMTMAMFRGEYHKLRTEGISPVRVGICILCHRFQTNRFVNAARARKMLGQYGLSAPGETSFELAAQNVIQLWYNIKEQEGGYKSEYLLLPEDKDECIVQPLAVFRYSALFAYKAMNEQDRWRIDQSQMCVERPIALPLPGPGEALTSFQEGAEYI